MAIILNRKRLFVIIVVAFLLILLGSLVLIPSKSLSKNDRSDDSEVVKEDIEINWDEITPQGVDEQKLILNINVSLLENIASLLQGLEAEIEEKEREDFQFVLEGKWYSYILESEEFKSVVNMGNRALKPLYLIVYKSPNQGLYEYICCMAIQKITNYEIGDWYNSKSFLELFNNYILKN